MKNLEQAPNQTICVYFIENHINTSFPKLSISGDSGGLFSELKKDKENIYPDSNKNENYLYAIYHFEIYPQKVKDRNLDKVKIKLTQENEGERYEYKMEITDFEKDNFIYNIEFKEKSIKILHKGKLLKSHKFERNKQYEIYRDYLEKDLGLNKLTDKKREDLVFFTQKLFDEKFVFSFYITIFVESFPTKNFRRHFSFFDLKKVDGKGNIEKYQKKATNYVKIIKNNPEKVLGHYKDQAEKDKIGEKLFAFILYYYYEYIHDEFLKSLEHEDKETKLYINNVLINYDHFKKVKLGKEKVQELISISKSYLHLSNSLQYLDLLLDLLNIVDSNFQKFKEIYLIEKKNKKDPKIDIYSLITPKENDNIKDICEKYKKLVELQKKEMKATPIIMSGPLIDKYISYFEGNNIDNLFYLKDIFKLIKINTEKDINKSIYETGLTLSKNGKMENFQILEFIKKLIKEKLVKESLEILKGLNVKNFNEQFYDEWKKIDWNMILDNNNLLSSFTNNIIGLVTDLKDFEILFKLLNYSTDPNVIEISSIATEKLQNKLIELYKNLDFNDKEFDLIKIIVLLISSLKKEKKDVEKFTEFLSQFEKISNEDKINELYISLLSVHEEILNEVIVKHIINFYTLDKELNLELLLKIITKCKDKIQGKFLDNINKAIPEEKDFLVVEKTEKYIFFKGLLENGVIANKNFKSFYYIERIYTIISNIQNKLKFEEIDWTELSIFYIQNLERKEQEKREEALSDKLLSIFLNDKDKADIAKSRLDELNLIIKKKYEAINIILEDFLGFFKETQKDNINKLEEYKKKLSSGPINFYDKNKENIEKLIKNYEQESRKRNEKNKSCFFSSIYKYNKNNFKNADEQTLIVQTEKDFCLVKEIFEDKGIQSLNKTLQKIFLETLKGKDEEEIKREIDTLIDLFEIKISTDKRNDVFNTLTLLLKKEDVEEISFAVSLFINNANLNKGNLWKLVEEITNHSEKLNTEEYLKKCIENLKKYNIDVNLLHEPKNYLNILLALKKKPGSINFLMTKNLNDCRNLQEAAGDNDNGFLNANDINDFRQCVEFMEKFQNNIQHDDDKFLMLLKKEVEKFKDIEIYFNKYVNNYDELKNLFETKFDKSTASKKIIISILENSKFTIKNVL